MIECGRRRKSMPAPPHVVWADLRTPKQEGVRAWLTLLDDEVPPTVLEADQPSSLVWSSLWPSRPDDQVVLTVAPDGPGSTLEFRWLAAGDAPSESTTSHIRRRLNFLLYGALRTSYDN